MSYLLSTILMSSLFASPEIRMPEASGHSVALEEQPVVYFINGSPDEEIIFEVAIDKKRGAICVPSRSYKVYTLGKGTKIVSLQPAHEYDENSRVFLHHKVTCDTFVEASVSIDGKDKRSRLRKFLSRTPRQYRLDFDVGKFDTKKLEVLKEHGWASE